MQLDEELRQIFLEEVSAYLRVLEDQQAPLEAQGDAAHGLKGAAGMLGFEELHVLAETLEHSLRRGDCAPRDVHLPRIRAIAEALQRGEPPAPTEAPSAPRTPSAPPSPADPAAIAFAEEFDEETAAMLRSFFAEEATEHLAAMENALGRLEVHPTDLTLVDALFRASHTIKGAAATVGLGLISEAAHRLEDRFEEIRDRGEPATPERLGALVRATDLLRAMVETDEATGHVALLAELREVVDASQGATGPKPKPAPVPAPEPTGEVDDDGWDEETRQILRETFAQEARELLDELTPLMETLSAGGRDASDVPRLFRLAHTLKGSAAAVSLPDLPTAAKRLEEHFELLQEGRPVPSPGPDLLATLMLLHELVDAAVAGTPTASLLQRFERAMAGQRVSLTPPAAPTTAAPAGTPALRHASGSRPTTLPAATPEVVEALAVEVERRGRPDRRGADRRQEDERLIRVNAERFDGLLSHVGEIVFRRTLIERRSEELTGLVRDFGRSHQGFRSALGELRNLRGAETHVQRFSELEVEFADELSNFERAEAGLREETEGLRRDAAHLQDGLTQIRLLSVRYLFARLRRAVRDIAHTEGKQVSLTTEGEETEIDRLVAEKLADPMIQIIRNAVAHGIEAPELRRQLGKPDAGLVTISATQEGNFVTLEVRDDGAGIDLDSVRGALVGRGLMSSEEAEDAPAEELTAAIFLPGLSTRHSADAVAGRGVGLDVVRDTIAKLGGEISVLSERQRGTRFVVRMPLSTAVTNALLFKAGGEVYCIPVRHVVETRYVKPEEIHPHRGRSAITVRGRPLPLLRLSELLTVEPRQQGKFLATLVLRHLEFEFAVAVDKIIGPREIVLRKLGPLLDPLDLYSSATISGAGKVQLVLDVPTLHRWASAWRTLPTVGAAALAPPRQAQRARILVCDDSRSIRQVVSRILAEEGFAVELASDGWDAWERMSALRVDLLLTDLEMPRMDGYALVEKCRRDDRLQDLPILVLSSRTGEENQRRAERAGANGFLFKPVNRRVIVSRIQELLDSLPRRM